MSIFWGSYTLSSISAGIKTTDSLIFHSSSFSEESSLGSPKTSNDTLSFLNNTFKYPKSPIRGHLINFLTNKFADFKELILNETDFFL